jgi:ankyrin repeat protein
MTPFDEIIGPVYRKDLPTVERLASKAINARDEDGRTPLMHAVLAEDADPLVVRFLIAHHADTNAFDNDQRWTALHFAARDQKEAIVRELLAAGAIVDALDVFENTPLWRCVSDPAASLAVAKELLAHGADPLRKNGNGMAPIDVARRKGRDDLVALFHPGDTGESMNGPADCP